MEYLTKEKRDFSPYFDLRFVVKIDEEREEEFLFPLYNPTRPFSEEQYLADIAVEIEYEVGLILTPPADPEPIPLDGF